MYRITLDNKTIYDPRIPRCFLEDPVLHQKANKVGTLSFRIYPTHAQYGQLVKLASVISVYKDSQPLPMWRGRVLSTVMRIDKSMEIECEDLLAYLLDSIVRPFDFSGGVADFLSYILTQHNEQVTEAQQIKLGTVTVVDPNDYIHRSSVDYLSSWEVIESKLVKLLGGYLRLRHETDGMYLDYLAGTLEDLPTAINVIEYGENLAELTDETDASETYTVCIPLGAKISSDDSTGGQSEQRITVASVNDGVDYIVNEEAFARYGWICAPVKDTTWDDVTLPANLLTKARAYLDGQGVKLKNTLKLKAIDQDFDFLNRVRVKSTPHNISAIYLLTEKKTPLADPKGADIILGDSSRLLSDTALSGFKDALQRIETVSGTVDLNNAQTNAEINELAQTAQHLQSTMERTAQELISQMSATYTSTTSFEEYKESISTQFTQTASAFSLQFDKLISQINTLNGESSQQFSEIRKYIRFDDGNIELGRSDSALILRITSDRISFLLNNVEIAYFSSGRLYVENLEAIRTLTVGNFTYLPRANGNLSLKTINQNVALARWNGSTTLVWDDLWDSTPDNPAAVMAVWDGASTFRWNELNTDAVWNVVEETIYHKVLVSADRKLRVECESNSIANGDSFTATVTALHGYAIDRVIVKMGDVDISDVAYADGIIYIQHVTGFVAISALAKLVTFEIVKQPEDVVAEIGETIQLTIEATGVATYQWQNSLDGEKWSDSGLSGYSTATLEIGVTEARYNYQWRCVVTDADGNQLISNPVWIKKPVEEFAIIKQPESVTAEVGETITFTVEATGAVTYQWQNSSNGTKWTNSGLGGNATATIRIPVTEARYPYLWRCVLTDAEGNQLISDAVKISAPVTSAAIGSAVIGSMIIGE